MEKIQWLNQVNGMQNPMQNLIGIMKNALCNMGVAEYADALQELDKAAEAIRKAVDLATEITYK